MSKIVGTLASGAGLLIVGLLLVMYGRNILSSPPEIAGYLLAALGALVIQVGVIGLGVRLGTSE